MLRMLKKTGRGRGLRKNAVERLGLRQRRAAQSERIGDEEAPLPAHRVLRREAKHLAADEYEQLTHAASVGDLDSDKYAQLLGDMTVEMKKKAISEASDRYWERKKAELGEAFDEEEVMTAFCRKSLLSTESNHDLMITAGLLIEEDWLAKVNELPGNIYRLAVLGEIFASFGAGGTMRDKVQSTAKVLGIASITLVQIIGPPLIFLSRIEGWGVLRAEGYKWHCCPWTPWYDPTSTEACYHAGTLAKDVTYFDDWHHIATTKLLGLLLMATFILNSLFVLLDEQHSWKLIYKTFRYLDVMNERFQLSGMQWLYADAIVNTWVITWCCFDVFLLIGAAGTPADVLMNALGLVFLYNLDDVGGDLGFVNEDDWPGGRFAWIYSELVENCPPEKFDVHKLDISGWLTVNLYNVVIGLLVVMVFAIPALAVITPWVQISPMA